MGEWHQDMKNHDVATSSKEPVTLENLAEVETNILKMLDRLTEKISMLEGELKRKSGEQ